MTHTGATRSQLTHWTHSGLISAGIAESAGTGYHRAFNVRDLIDIRVAVLLASFGMTVPGMSFVLKMARRTSRRGRRQARPDHELLPGVILTPYRQSLSSWALSYAFPGEASPP